MDSPSKSKELRGHVCSQWFSPRHQTLKNAHRAFETSCLRTRLWVRPRFNPCRYCNYNLYLRERHYHQQVVYLRHIPVNFDWGLGWFDICRDETRWDHIHILSDDYSHPYLRDITPYQAPHPMTVTSINSIPFIPERVWHLRSVTPRQSRERSFDLQANTIFDDTFAYDRLTRVTRVCIIVKMTEIVRWIKSFIMQLNVSSC